MPPSTEPLSQIAQIFTIALTRYHIFMDPATQIIFQIVILIFSVVIHEVSHGYAALALGDKTAQYSGRLTLNPVKHLDFFGSFLLPLLTYFLGGFIIGWAKPVPYNPYNLKNQKWGPAMVGAAGPFANIALALIFGLLVRFLPLFSGGTSALFIVNFITIAGTITFLNLLLALFNLLPIPPLDGSKLLFAFLSYRMRGVELFLEQYGFFLLLLFIFFLSRWLFIPILFLFHLITGTFPVF